MSVIEIIKRNYKNEVIFSDRPLLILFSTKDCDVCRALLPIVDEIADENLGIKVCNINAAVETDIARSFDVSELPTLIVFKARRVTARSVGLVSKDDILKMLNEK